MEFNINHNVRVRLTKRGKEIIDAEGISMPNEDKNGYSEWQLWYLMKIFGQYLYNGCNVPFETTIQIPDQNILFRI